MKLPQVNLRDLINERFTRLRRAPHFRLKKDLIFYLNSSRAAPRDGISASLRQAAGNSNLNTGFPLFIMIRPTNLRAGYGVEMQK